MAEFNHPESAHPADRQEGADQVPVRQRRSVDLIVLFFGLATLCASVYTITDGPDWLPPIAPKWLLAGTALVIGTLMLLLSARKRP